MSQGTVEGRYARMRERQKKREKRELRKRDRGPTPWRLLMIILSINKRFFLFMDWKPSLSLLWSFMGGLGTYTQSQASVVRWPMGVLARSMSTYSNHSTVCRTCCRGLPIGSGLLTSSFTRSLRGFQIKKKKKKQDQTSCIPVLPEVTEWLDEDLSH